MCTGYPLILLEVEITTFCNRRCLHCYVPERGKNIEITLLEKILDEARGLGTKIVTISGGEPLLHPRFNEVLALLRKYEKDYIFLLQTNGDFLKEETFRYFQRIQIGYDPLNLIRGPIRLKFLFGLPRSKRKKLYFFITFYKKLVEKVKKDPSWFINHMKLLKKKEIEVGYNFYIGENKNLIISKKEELEMLSFLSYLSRKGLITKPRVVFSWMFRNEIRNLKLPIPSGCIAGIISGYVDVNGNFFPCPFVRTSAGNLKRESLRKIWEHSSVLKKLRARKWCRDCIYSNICGGCRARALIYNGNLFSKDPYCALVESDVWDKMTPDHSKKLRSKRIVDKVEKILKDMKMKPKKVIEFGLGTGEVIKVINKLYPNAEFYGVDISKKMIEIAENKLKKANFIQGDIRYTFVDEDFDLALSTYGVVNNLHGEDLEVFFRNVWFHLKNKGIFIFDYLKDSSKTDVRIERYLFNKDTIEENLKRYFKILKAEELDNRRLIVAKKLVVGEL